MAWESQSAKVRWLPARAPGDTDAWLLFRSQADGWAAQAAQGEPEACAKLLGSPVELKRWLDAQAGCHAGWPGAERFMERALDLDAEALAAQYAALAQMGGAMDFKSDVQGIERSILLGSLDALSEMMDRSPMALWAMDFTLSEYEAENVLTFAAKYAPEGVDRDIIALLMSRGAKLPPARMVLTVGPAMTRADGIWIKSPRLVADAMEAAGHRFSEVDGYAMAQLSLMEDALATPGEMLSTAGRTVDWLVEMERRGVDWSKPLGDDEIDAFASSIPPHYINPLRREQFVELGRRASSAGLGTWFGMAGSSLRDESYWSELGPFLASRGLAGQALEAAVLSGARATWERILPYAEAETLAAAAGAEHFPGGADGRPTSAVLRI